ANQVRSGCHYATTCLNIIELHVSKSSSFRLPLCHYMFEHHRIACKQIKFVQAAIVPLHV
ncbi:MAG: hypothetical protein II081_01530, partial [Prevotella sp.]|nr:hypothetical protein [Prevotella sp.]